MAVAIRLKRFGKKKNPVYRVVSVDQRKPRDGKVLEELGFYNPKNMEELKFNEERISYWLSVGAQPTATVRRLLASKGFIKDIKRVSSQLNVKKKDRKKSNSED
ncbi:30S ribosomal protein S16 [Candidatus Marinamargulisbacteria bacterium SCGC AG-343-D04]|nr:30S ribosomal protein S16 [Candidatus Marinamargulisbacteria bacterium SCGC AG-343-D04]